MTDVIAHRGPDGEGHYIDVNIALGHRRLSVIDLSSAGSQPMATRDGRVVVVFNGCIYNFQKLRVELETKGHQFQSKTDTEVLLHGYEEYGISFVEQLNGMFAFALWDATQRTLFLARDRFGVKPLYWLQNGDTFIFSSEIKAILTHPDVSKDIDLNALNEYFTFQNLFGCNTLFKGVSLLPAATLCWITEGSRRLEQKKWWDYDFTHSDSAMTEKEAEETTFHLFQRAITRQLVSDAPIGSYLSGGMDSGSIVAVAASEIPRLATFTCGFFMHSVDGVEADFDERKEAELLANLYKTEHYEQVVGSGDLSWALPRLVYHLEDLRMGMSYPNYYISRLASKFVKVCLSGAGGDELYGGYPWRYYRIFNSVDKDDYLKAYYLFWQRLVLDEDKPSFFTSETWRQVVQKDTFQTFSTVFDKNLKYDSPEEHIANSLYFEIKTFLHGLFIVADKLSMANGLEERVPFMDNDLVDFAMKIPVSYKLGNLENFKKMDENELRKVQKYRHYNDGKNVLREAMQRLIPKEALARKKQGFSAPDESWYRGHNIHYIKKVLLNKRALYRDFINPKFVEKTISEHCEQKKNRRLLLWSLLCFEHWCKVFLHGQIPDRTSITIE